MPELDQKLINQALAEYAWYARKLVTFLSEPERTEIANSNIMFALVFFVRLAEQTRTENLTQLLHRHANLKQNADFNRVFCVLLRLVSKGGRPIKRSYASSHVEETIATDLDEALDRNNGRDVLRARLNESANQENGILGCYIRQLVENHQWNESCAATFEELLSERDVGMICANMKIARNYEYQLCYRTREIFNRLSGKIPFVEPLPQNVDGRLQGGVMDCTDSKKNFATMLKEEDTHGSLGPTEKHLQSCESCRLDWMEFVEANFEFPAQSQIEWTQQPVNYFSDNDLQLYEFAKNLEENRAPAGEDERVEVPLGEKITIWGTLANVVQEPGASTYQTGELTMQFVSEETNEDDENFKNNLLVAIFYPPNTGKIVAKASLQDNLKVREQVSAKEALDNVIQESINSVGALKSSIVGIGAFKWIKTKKVFSLKMVVPFKAQTSGDRIEKNVSVSQVLAYIELRLYHGPWYLARNCPTKNRNAEGMRLRPACETSHPPTMPGRRFCSVI